MLLQRFEDSGIDSYSKYVEEKARCANPAAAKERDCNSEVRYFNGDERGTSEAR